MEDKLLEAACYGDIEAIRALIIAGAHIDAKNKMNGWTALHWAARRGQYESVKVLLNHGAKIDVLSNDNKTPVDVATNNQIKSMLGRCSTDQDGSADIQNANQSTFVPNYLQYPAIGHTVDLGVLEQQCEVKSQIPAETVQAAVTSVILDSRVRILKIRVASLKDLDFIEIDLPQKMTRYNDLLEAICKELNVEPAKVERIRKLPNTRLRRDIEVTRLTDYTELELVLLLEK